MNPNANSIAMKSYVSPDDYTEFAEECRIEGETHSAMMRRLMKTYTKNQQDSRERAKKERANLGPVWALSLPGRANYATSMRSLQ
ncbi:hypothetical protein CR152_27765 [Massilia violaceinigra]|uniref:Ribbon-helix-helix protein CopG domain-containing protein n=1 Tax=Massilia violaceinigra TaxID=2045208 RepID=A0A2D2DSC1_9BURK|nr:hypothetical protein [Massilia violaceinigra]ATQ77875.1 hypothetical protein CR152_27765 [Massilia violaceinigra]